VIIRRTAVALAVVATIAFGACGRDDGADVRDLGGTGSASGSGTGASGSGTGAPSGTGPASGTAPGTGSGTHAE
jgi:hypothetical protein